VNSSLAYAIASIFGFLAMPVVGYLFAPIAVRFMSPSDYVTLIMSGTFLGFLMLTYLHIETLSDEDENQDEDGEEVV
jgi:hypothetical protein